ncbi:MAG TPA: YoaK family protein [Luteibacter sp.]|uniref:YoaK family protein n=1 Tax=Luteibacter sp. TaxID=1886636 RepID=UPI002C0DABA0|nr:YoaK family protein [Luteibacter sp.]HVI56198.1 YoaK family protein [Luteibacter sp.]
MPAPMTDRDPLVVLLTLLSLTTGLVDATSVLGLGKVFTANMTGNVVFLGFAAAGAHGFQWQLYVLALAAFGIGAIGSGRLGRFFVDRSRRRWLVVSASIEASLFWIAAVCAFVAPGDIGPGLRLTLVALVAIAMGARNATVRQLNVPDLTTTVVTRTITGLAADSRLAGGPGQNLGRRLRAILSLFVGAAVGAFMVLRWGLAPPLALAGAAVLAFTWFLAKDEQRGGA